MLRAVKIRLVPAPAGSEPGTECKTVLEKMARRQVGSKGRRRAPAERDNFIGRVLNQLPLSRLKTVVVEDLKRIRSGKKGKRSKQLRRKTVAWTAAKLMSRLGDKCEENRVLLACVPPAYTGASPSVA